MIYKIPRPTTNRLKYILDLSWEIFFNKVISGRIKINKEQSMQLHYSTILLGLGELMCIKPKERFNIELESSYGRKNIDITCSYGDKKAALELKCFRKKSNRARDTDLYDVLKDIERLLSYNDFQVRKFICLTDDPYYIKKYHKGFANKVSIGHGKQYTKNKQIKPDWVGRWKNKSRDEPIEFNKDITFNWKEKDEWYYLNMDL